MVKYAVIDVETTGLFDFSKPADAEGQPRLASLSIILLDEDLKSVTEETRFIKPDGWSMNPEATAINRLTDEYLNDVGQPILEVLSEYTNIINAGHVIASFNAQYDTKVMRGEMRRALLPDLFEKTPNICLMRACTDICQVPRKKGNGFKFPKLSEACAFFGIEQEEGHTSAGDASAAFGILLELNKLDALPAPAVHYAKKRPE